MENKMNVNQLTDELNAWVAGDQDTHVLIMSFRDACEPVSYTHLAADE